MNSWKKIILKILLFIVLLLGATIFLISTPVGINLLVNSTSLLIPKLKIEQVSGNWKNLFLKNIRYNQLGIKIKVDELHLAVNLNYLCKGNLQIDDLSLKNINIVINPKIIFQSKKINGKSDKGNDYNFLNFLISNEIILNRMLLRNFNIKIDETTVSVVNFISGFYWKEKTLTLKPTSLQDLLVILPKRKQEDQKNNTRNKILDLNIEKKLTLTNLKNLLSKPMLLKITDVHLPINLNIIEFKGKKLRLINNKEFIIYNVLLKVKNINDNMYLDILNIDSNQGTINATGNAQIHDDNCPIDIAIDSILNIKPLKGEKISLRIGGAIRKKVKVDINLSGQVNMILHAQTQLTKAGLPLSINILSKKLHWPLIGKKRYQAKNFNLKLNGMATGYTLSFNISIKGKSIPPSIITLHAKGNEQQINFNKLTIIALEGKAELVALLNWKRSIKWDGELKLNKINIVKEIPNWTSRLNGIIRTNGSFYRGNWEIDVPKIEIIGNLNQNKINIEGALNSNSHLKLVIPGIYLTLGNNSANIKGKLGIENLNFKIIINAPNLNKIIPGLYGIVRGFIKIYGNIETPKLLTDITANKIRWKKSFINDIHISSNLRSSKQIGGELKVYVGQVINPNLKINLATLNIVGNEKEHNIKLKIKGEQVYGKLHLIGRLDRKEGYWEGLLNNTYFSNNKFGTWLLNKHSELECYSDKRKINIGSYCCKNQKFIFYTTKAVNLMSENTAVVNINQSNPEMLKPFISSFTKISGIFNGKIGITWNTNKNNFFQSKVTLSGYNVKVIQLINNSPFLVKIDPIILNINFHDDCVALDWVIHLTNNGWFDGQFIITDLHRYQNLNGNISIRNLNLEIANIIFSRGEKVSGMLNANLKFLGSIIKPQVFGKVQINNININSSFMPFEMHPSILIMNFNGVKSTFYGKLHTKQGLIKLVGNVDWNQTRDFHAYMFLTGKRVRINVSPMISLEISPDISFKVTPNLFTFNGRVDVPWMRVVIRELPESMIAVSNDEMMLNENLKPIRPKNVGILINSNLSIHIGNDIWVDAFGLRARLAGDLQITQDRQGIGLNGRISIPEGNFNAYGQDLLIRKGELLFSGPLDQPLLNIEAIRKPETIEDNVIAGIRIIGTPDAPKVKIFSSPSMSQRDTLSYLLRGQSLDSNKSDSTLITSMLVGLGISKSSLVIDKIAEILGINSLELDTKGIGNSSKVIVSGYILPSLQVKYSVGFVDSLTTLTLRYRIMHKLYLEAVSGIDQALDLLYQFEF